MQVPHQDRRQHTPTPTLTLPAECLRVGTGCSGGRGGTLLPPEMTDRYSSSCCPLRPSPTGDEADPVRLPRSGSFGGRGRSWFWNVSSGLSGTYMGTWSTGERATERAVPTDRQTDRQADRQTDRQVHDFQLTGGPFLLGTTNSERCAFMNFCIEFGSVASIWYNSRWPSSSSLSSSLMAE